jgi:hypothetical protein
MGNMLARAYEKAVVEFQPRNEVEKRDSDALIGQANAMLRVIDAAEAEISRARAEIRRD